MRLMFQSADLVVATGCYRLSSSRCERYCLVLSLADKFYNHEAIQSKEVLGCVQSVYEWLGQGRQIVEDTR